MAICFSIILPTYNRATFLPRAIKSVMAQGYSNWELIVVDDGSTDETEQLVKQYAKKEKRIKYLYQENAERSVARNNGIKNAKGNFICFLDSDDYYHTTHLENFVDLITNKGFEDALYFSGVSVNKFSQGEQKYYTSVQNKIEFILLNSLGTPRACVSKNCFNNNLFDRNIRIGEDTDLWVRMGLLYNIYFHKVKTFVEVEHESRSINGNSCYAHLITLRKILSMENVKKKVSNKVRKNIICNTYFNIAKYEMGNKKRLKSMNFLAKSIFRDPSNKQTKLKINLLIQLIIQKDLDLILKIAQ